MAFEMLTGRRPFTGDNYNMLIINIITSPAPDATAVDPTVPYAISQVIARSLKMDRAQRYETARALREALDEAVLESGSRSSQVIALTPAAVRPASIPATTSSKSKVDPVIAGADSLAALTVEPPSPAASSGRSPLIYAVVALVVGLAIAGGAVALRSPSPGSTAAVPARPPQASRPMPPETTVAARPEPASNAQPSAVPAPQQVPAQPTQAQPSVRGARARAGSATTATGPAVTTTVTTATAAAVTAATTAITTATSAASATPERPQADPAAQPERPAQPERAAEPANSASATATNNTGSTANSGSTTTSRTRRFRFVTNYPGTQNPGTQ